MRRRRSSAASRILAGVASSVARAPNRAAQTGITTGLEGALELLLPTGARATRHGTGHRRRRHSAPRRLVGIRRSLRTVRAKSRSISPSKRNGDYRRRLRATSRRSGRCRASARSRSSASIPQPGSTNRRSMTSGRSSDQFTFTGIMRRRHVRRTVRQPTRRRASRSSFFNSDLSCTGVCELPPVSADEPPRSILACSIS